MIYALYSETSESGKDSTADAIAEWARMEQRTFSRAAFADEMKIVCANALGMCELPREEKIGIMDLIKLAPFGSVHYQFQEGKDGPIAYSTGQAGRDFIIGLAESIRALDKTFWVRHSAPPEAEIQVLTDLRFVPEAMWVREQGGKIIEVIRPDTVRHNEDRLPPSWIDAQIQNDGTLDDLGREAFIVMDALVPPGA